ncbi:MAG: hypothetical protein HFG95_09785 [Dorea sp.]|nr:hypothetical protein [Dorea sp.]
MKLIQDLPEIFEEFKEKRRQAFLEIKEYKDKGNPVVGMYCAYFPTELAMAVGAIPVGLCSFANETVSAAERELPKSMCPLVKSSYGFAVEDKCPFFHFADLVIGETTCDGKKKMYELMAEFKPVFVMELPNSQSGKGIEFWKQEVLRTKEFFEEFFHVVITDRMIREAVHISNEIRTSLKKLYEVMKLNPAPVLGGDIQKIVTGSKYCFDFQTTPEVVDAVTAKILEEYDKGKMLEYRPRILVTGCPIGGDSMKIIHEIESNGGVVVAVENCSGVKTLDQMIDEEEEDIYGAIARRYLSTGCSIMTPNDNRIELLGRIIDEYQVDGVVEMVLTGCHATGAESIYIRKFVNKEKGIPYIAIDTDYSPADKGQIATRLSAFLEMIQVQDDELDMNYCYKIVLSGLTRGDSMNHIVKKVRDYTKIPICIYDQRGRKIPDDLYINKTDIKSERIIEKVLEGNCGKIVAFIPPEKRRTNVLEILDILAKSYELRERSFCVQKLKAQQDTPDFLWVLSESTQALKAIYKGASEIQAEMPCLVLHDDKSIFVSCVQGKDGREKFIRLCEKYMEKVEGFLLIGNGFFDVHNKENNKAMQYEILKIIKRNKIRKKIYLTENYYYELAAAHISKMTEKGIRYQNDLECIKREDEEKGKNLYETLYWYLKMKRNISQTAASLKIHRNTLLPRIARINELIALDEKDGAECEKLFLTMEVELLGVNRIL